MRNQYRLPLFCIVTMFYWFSLYSYVPIFAPYLSQLGISSNMTGIIIGSYGLTQMLLKVPVGIISDKIRKRKLFMIIGICLGFVSAVGLSLTKNVQLIFLFRALAGVAAATWVDFTILFSSYYKHEEATKAIGTINFFTFSAQMLAMLLGGWISDRLGWQASFALGAVIGMFGLGGSLFLKDNNESNPKPVSIKESLLIVKDPTVMSVSFLAILSQMLTFATVYGFTPVLADHMGVTKFQLGLLTVCFALPTALASLLIGRRHFIKRFREKQVVIGGFILMGIFTLLTPFMTSIWQLMAAQSIVGLGRGFSFPVLMGLSIKDISNDKRSTAMGFFQAVYGLGMFAGPVLMGIIGELVTLRQGFVILGIIGCLTALMAGVTIRPKIPVGAKSTGN